MSNPVPGTRFRILSTLGLALGAATLVLCLLLAVASYVDDSSSTAAVGFAIAIVLAVPVLISLGLTIGGVAARRRNDDAGMGLVVAGLVVIAILDALIAAQLLLGS